ncbi:hypothetical protein ACJVDH_20020 [Pedobacter sp. AW1-32]|uniref:hypothetical protein n=1 Tax=Pedobacter sp. AW1-32 TaxID=3383026 RepID=UPI003FF0261F
MDTSNQSPAAHLQKKLRKRLKQWLLMAFTVALCTSIQILWAAPDAMSSADLSSSPLGYLHWLCILPISITLALNNWFGKHQTTINWQLTILTGFMVLYWLSVNYVEFVDREASWSTFSTTESWYATVMISRLPIGVCGVVFILSMYFLLEKAESDLKQNISCR